MSVRKIHGLQFSIQGSKKRPLPVDDDDDADDMPLTSNKEEVGGEEDMISMALRMAEEMSGPIADLESAVEAVPINTGMFVCVCVCSMCAHA